MTIRKYSVTTTLKEEQSDAFLTCFFNDADCVGVSSLYSDLIPQEVLKDVRPGINVRVQAKKLNCTVFNMEFFDKFQDLSLAALVS